MTSHASSLVMSAVHPQFLSYQSYQATCIPPSNTDGGSSPESYRPGGQAVTLLSCVSITLRVTGLASEIEQCPVRN